MNIQEENSARYFRVQSEREQTLVVKQEKPASLRNMILPQKLRLKPEAYKSHKGVIKLEVFCSPFFQIENLV